MNKLAINVVASFIGFLIGMELINIIYSIGYFRGLSYAVKEGKESESNIIEYPYRNSRREVPQASNSHCITQVQSETEKTEA